ncbi:hypothetical protein [Amycolatopsis sp. GA6-003]|uniref:hypothetical protein n=1 Tax=Amycolatopsis sp. GA6-003 TaxID=2652444 RepID=UPI0039172F5E
MGTWIGRLGIDREEVARRMGMDKKTVDRIIQGTAVAKATLGRLETALGWMPGSTQAVLAGGQPIVPQPLDAETQRALAKIQAEAAEIRRKLELVSDIYDDYGPEAARAAIAKLSAELADLNRQIAELTTSSSDEGLSQTS